MHKVDPHTHQNNYCSQNHNHLSNVPSIQKGVKIIEKLLNKDIICRHDVENINHVYRSIDLIERQTDAETTSSSLDALTLIINKIKTLARKHKISPQEIVSLYHLQKFSDLDMGDIFVKSLEKFLKNAKDPTIQDLARSLPFCTSEALFDQDTDILIGQKKSNHEVEEILHEKKYGYKKHTEKMQKILTKKEELAVLRENSPQNYPAYLGDLLDHGYIYTYDHLIQMQNIPDRNNRKKAIEKMSFSEVSHIVLEIREYFIHILKNSIPKNADKILFLLGPTGAGKSTALCFLRGDEMVLNDFSYDSKNDKEGLIGHELSSSCTFLPKIELINDITIVDFPGFDDSNGPVITLGIELALKALINQFKPNILVLESITDVESKYANAASLGYRLKRILTNPDSCILGITKYSQNIHYQKIKEIEKEQNQPSREEIKLRTRIELVIEDLQDEKDPEIILKLQQKKQEYETNLKNIIQERTSRIHIDTPEKILSIKKIQEIEGELSKQLGLTRILKLSELENNNYLQHSINLIFNSSNYKPNLNPHFHLDTYERDILNTIFYNNLLEKLNSHTPNIKNLQNIESFYQSVSDYSLIYTIASSEIGNFLHLPEIDPRIVLEFDKRIVDGCIQNYMQAAIGGVNISVLEKVLERATNLKKVEKVKIQIKNYKEFIKGLLGVKPTQDQKKSEMRWKEIEEQYQLALEAVEDKFKLPTWAIVGLAIPIIPITVYAIWKKFSVESQQKKIIEELTDMDLDRLSTELEYIQNALSLLKQLEMIVKIKKYKNENK